MKTDKSKFQQGTFNLYTADHLPDTHREFYEKQQRNLPESTINPTIPEFIRDEALVLYQSKRDTNYKGEITYYLETNPIIVLVSESGIICVLRKDFQSGRYRFFPYHDHYQGAHKISIGKRSRAIEFSEPNKIGSWTDKKVNDWIEYCEKYVEIMESLVNKYDTIHSTHAQTIQDFISDLPDCTVRKGAQQTFVDTELFDVAFTNDYGIDYLRTDIKFKGKIDDVLKIETVINQ